MTAVTAPRSFMKLVKQYVGSLLEQPAQGMGLFVLRRATSLTDSLTHSLTDSLSQETYSFELWLDGYQSHCLRQWLELRWKTPCLQNSRVLRDASTGNSAIFQILNVPTESDAKLQFGTWIDQLTKAKASLAFDRR